MTDQVQKKTKKMSKKKITMVALSLALIAIMITGATLAYFTAEQETLSNVFTLGGVEILLTEAEVEYNLDTNIFTKVAPENRLSVTDTKTDKATSQYYKAIEPGGSDIPKDPQVKNVGLNSAYVIYKVEVKNYDWLVKYFSSFAVGPLSLIGSPIVETDLIDHYLPLAGGPLLAEGADWYIGFNTPKTTGSIIFYLGVNAPIVPGADAPKAFTAFRMPALPLPGETYPIGFPAAKMTENGIKEYNTAKSISPLDTVPAEGVYLAENTYHIFDQTTGSTDFTKFLTDLKAMDNAKGLEIEVSAYAIQSGSGINSINDAWTQLRTEYPTLFNTL